MIAVVDFGSQYTHLIARRIRQLGVAAEIFPSKTHLTKVENLEGIILSGGPASIYGKGSSQLNKGLFARGSRFDSIRIDSSLSKKSNSLLFL